MAKKSFDIGRTPRKTANVQQRHKHEKKKTRPHPRLSQRSAKRPLRKRRQDEALRTLSLWSVGVLVVAGLVLFGVWRPEARIRTIEVTGEVTDADAQGMVALARQKLEGTYYHLIPRDSFFFYPEDAVRGAILEEYPAVAAVSVGRSSLTSLALKISPRVAAFYWCGVPSSLSGDDTTCYKADAEGFVFAPLHADPASGLPHVYAMLDTEHAGVLAPLRARVQGTGAIPSILRFVRDIERMGIPVASVAIREDEADLFVVPNTRITYVIGKEAEARKNAEAAFPTLNLQDGSIEYIDLRFEGKVYLKRRGE